MRAGGLRFEIDPENGLAELPAKIRTLYSLLPVAALFQQGLAHTRLSGSGREYAPLDILKGPQR